MDIHLLFYTLVLLFWNWLDSSISDILAFAKTEWYHSLPYRVKKYQIQATKLPNVLMVIVGLSRAIETAYFSFIAQSPHK